MLVTTLGYGATVPNARVAHVQLHRTRGARFHVSGIPWTAGRSALSRIYAAFEGCGLPRVAGALTLHIRPTDQLKELTALDLPIAHPSVHTSPAAEAIFQQHANAFSTSTRGIGHLKAVARLHAALEQNTQTNTLEIGEVDAAFASQLRIFDRPRWWEKAEIP